MKCALCNADFNDGAQCSVCKKHLDFGCASITESGYRKLGPDRMAKWRCPQCKIAASSSATSAGKSADGGASTGDSGRIDTDQSGPATIEAVLKEVRDLKSRLAGLPGLFDEVKGLKSELTDLKASCDYSCGKVDDFEKRLSTIEKKMPELERVLGIVNATQETVANLKKELGDKEQWSRLNNVEIKGVPLRKEENLFSIIGALSKKVGYEFPKSQINYISRVPTFNSKDKSIIVSFVNRYVKEEFIAAARALKNLTAGDIGAGDTRRIFVNDHLTPDQKIRLTKTKALKKSHGYLYVWVKYCKIHVRKNDTSPVIIVSKDSDLNKLT